MNLGRFEFSFQRLSHKATAFWCLLGTLYLSLDYCILMQRVEAQQISVPKSEIACQITAMTILAEKGTGQLDPKLETVNDRLLQILPGHFFKLIEGRTTRLEENQFFTIKASQDSKLSVTLKQATTDEGKVELVLKLNRKNQQVFESVVKTPPNQLFFVDQKISDTQRQLIAVGAR